MTVRFGDNDLRVLLMAFAIALAAAAPGPRVHPAAAQESLRIAAVVNDDVVVVGGQGAIIADLTTWGWVTILLAIILVLTGFGLLTGAEWARWAGVFIVGLNAIAQVWIFPAAPLWAFIIILLDVIIIYNLTARWSGTSAV